MCVRQFSAHTDTNSHSPFSTLFPDDFHSFLSFALFCFKALFHDVMCNISHSPSLFLLHIEYYLHLNTSQSDTFSRLLCFSFLFHFTVCRFKIHFGFDRFLGLCLMNGFFYRFLSHCSLYDCFVEFTFKCHHIWCDCFSAFYALNCAFLFLLRHAIKLLLFTPMRFYLVRCVCIIRMVAWN